MRRLSTLLLTCGLTLAAFALPTLAQDGPRPDGNAGGDRPAHPDGPPPGGVHILPRGAGEKLKLTDDQKKQIADLEEETKAKLDKILTPEQKKTLEELRPPRGPGGPRGGDQGGQQGGENDRPPRGGPGGGDAPPSK